MNDIETITKKITDEIKQYQILDIKEGIWNDKTELAEELQYKLTMLKLQIGPQNFDELSYFRRWSQKIDRYLNSVDNQIQKGGK